jgi:hypothetical protein
MEMKGKIDYGIACAQKADTTTLHHWLGQHPQLLSDFPYGSASELAGVHPWQEIRFNVRRGLFCPNS